MTFFKTKMSFVILLCTFLSIVSIGTMSIFTANHILKESSRQNLRLQCESTGRQMNESLDSISRSVDILSQTALAEIGDPTEFKRNGFYMGPHTAKLSYLARTLAENTPGCTSVYIRYNPEISSPTAGFFWVRSQKNGQFYEEAPTDITLYSPDDIEHVGWYYIPQQHRAPIWMPPYENKNIQMHIVSYIVPLFIGKEFIGLAGMDINFHYIQRITQSIHLYNSGYAFLVYKDMLIDHRDFPVYTPISSVFAEHSSAIQQALDDPSQVLGEYSYHGLSKSFAAMPLHNGMHLFVCAPSDEIYHDSVTLTKKLIFIAIFSFLFISIIINYILTRILKLATKDSLTNLPNRTYFLQHFASMQTLRSLSGHSLFLMDIDEFKQINDTFGHNNGDLVLHKVAADAARILGKDTILARWGGDEFIGLIRSDKAQDRLEKLREHVEHQRYLEGGTVTLSLGVVCIHPPATLKQLTRAADTALYQAKSNGRNQVVFNMETMPS